MDYHEKLNILKASMEGGTELEIVADLINEHTASEKLGCLDVGIGDGRYTEALISRLQNRNIQLNLRGIEPDKGSYQRAVSRFDSNKIHNSTIDEFETNREFDIVLCNHTVYYLDLQNSMRKIKTMLTDQGLLLVGLWTPNDDLYNLKEQIWGDPLSPNDVTRILDRIGMRVIDKKFFTGEVDYSSWFDEDNLRANLDIISRKEPVTDEDIKSAKNILSDMENKISSRENIILMAKRNLV